MVSAAEYKVGALFYNARNMIPMKMTLQKLKYSQPPTPMKIDNMTALGIINKTIKTRRTKALDMRFY